ncbi:MAG: hypothetical protein HUK12_01470, partial [Muribaculaceae bacterium]|nr:hypothetical protein [Muribaculaceae bacterium]MCF0203968.1 hypothetical protein [Muribaculaceae bacterium]
TTSETAKLYALAVAIDALTDNLEEADLALLDLLKQLKEAVEARTDYSGIIAAIRSLLPEEPGIDFEYVDLGLRSGNLWATCNMGAESPEQLGDYYGWGMTEPYAEGDDTSWASYFSRIGGTATEEYECGGEGDPLKEYFNGGSLFYIANEAGEPDGIGATEWDVVWAASKGGWRMPTLEDYKELFSICSWKWESLNDVKGIRFTSHENGNSIFFPSTGIFKDGKIDTSNIYSYYSTSSPYSRQECNINMCIRITYEYSFGYDAHTRNEGQTIRPVKVQK